MSRQNNRADPSESDLKQKQKQKQNKKLTPSPFSKVLLDHELAFSKPKPKKIWEAVLLRGLLSGSRPSINYNFDSGVCVYVYIYMCVCSRTRLHSP